MRPSKLPKLLLLLILVLPALALGACGSDDNEKAGGAKAPAEAEQAFNATDAAFAANMLPHHEGGVKLGQLAVEKGVNPVVKSVGQDIVDAQTSEVKTLEGFLKDFGADMPVMAAPIEERDMREMKALEGASGAAFDELWLEVISGHHSAAIQMAEIEKAGGKSPEAKALAESIVSTQTAELTKFNELLAK